MMKSTGSEVGPKVQPNTIADRRPWVAPRLEEMPRLTELTLATGPAIPGGGGTGGGGSTVF